MVIAVTYLRVSGNAQLDGGGFDRQLDTCTALASSKAFTIARTFEEKAIPGWKDEDERPAFQAMVAYMLDSGTKILIVEGLDRLARSYRVQEQLILYLAAKGLELYAANTGENITQAVMGDPMKKALVQIQGVFAELDKSMIVAKLKKGRQRTKEKLGRCEGQKPFGHYPGEGLILASILTNREFGMTCQAIADTLNSRRLPTRKGGIWHSAVIAAIVRRESTTVLRSTCAVSPVSSANKDGYVS